MIPTALHAYEAALADESRDLADAVSRLRAAVVYTSGERKFWNASIDDLLRFANWAVEGEDQKARRVELVTAMKRRTFDHERDMRETFRHEATP